MVIIKIDYSCGSSPRFPFLEVWRLVRFIVFNPMNCIAYYLCKTTKGHQFTMGFISWWIFLINTFASNLLQYRWLLLWGFEFTSTIGLLGTKDFILYLNWYTAMISIKYNYFDLFYKTYKYSYFINNKFRLYFTHFFKNKK